MQYGKIESFQSGVAIPLFSLRSDESCGIGEFYDLVPYAEWCNSVGINLIQLLPVNDTGEESSPYGAKSAFALNPIFIRLDDVPGVQSFKTDLKKSRESYNKNARVPYGELYRYKLEFLRSVFQKNFKTLTDNVELHKWIEHNSWIRTYSAYSFLKEQNGKKSWKEWSSSVNPTAKTIDTIWEKEWNAVMFFAWVQFIAEKQFLSILPKLEPLNVKLKGDIPILINEDSADVWGSRKYFDLNFRAGAPPDMFCYTGQNWGFPCYNWSALEKEDYSWWRMRLTQSSKFFHAIRIDHVLGFFRIWQTPETEQTGMLGVFNPYSPIKTKRLLEAGFSESTISYLTNPVYSKEYLCQLLGGFCKEGLSRYFDKLNDNEYRLSETVNCESKIMSLNETHEIKVILQKIYWNKVFISHNEGEFYPFWYFYESPVFVGLPEHEQKKLFDIINECNNSQEKMWEESGRKLLGMMAQETDMLVCAEDLGVVPNCVGKVLQELGMLSLKIERWTRDYGSEGSPFIDPKSYPRLSVCSPSCHDSSTLRGYWEEEWDKGNYFNLLKINGECPATLTEEVAKHSIERLLLSNSLLAIIPFQDLMALKSEMVSNQNPDDERINIPGTMGQSNWTWRMSMNIKALKKSKKYNAFLKEFLSIRGNMKLN